MTTHERQRNDFKVSLYFKPPQYGSQLFRAVCSCDWAGCWFADLDYVDRSFDRHVEQSLPKRDCGHAFTHAGLCFRCPPDPMESL